MALLNLRRSHFRRTGLSTVNRVGSVIAVIALALLFHFSHRQTVYAQNADCGEPERSQTVEGQTNNNLNRTFKLDRCIVRNFKIGNQDKKIVVYFTTSNGIASDQLADVDADGQPGTELTSTQIANRVADWTETAWRAYNGYGFADPHGQSTFRVHVFDTKPGLLGWCCTTDSYEIDAPSVRSALTFGNDVRDAESVAYHEMWHAMETSTNLGGWVVEGSASYMTDHVTLPVDNDPMNDYMGRVGRYMGNGHTTSITEHAYVAAPWWTYLNEQFTTINTEPNRGVDIMREFITHSNTTAFSRIDAIIRAHNVNRSLTSVWMDFGVANYAKDLSGNVPALYRYQDETQASAPNYPGVALARDEEITKNAGFGPELQEVNAWAAKYYQFEIASDVPIINVEFYQDTNRRLGYALLKIRNNDLVETTYAVGGDFVKSFANNNFTHIVVVVMGFEEYANFRYAINGDMTLNIVDPLSSRQKVVGAPNAPEKFMIKLDAFTGSGDPIEGIDPSSFAITVGTETVQPADRISAAYIQGQYWLLVRAPVQTNPGVYDVTVSYAGLTDTETQAVRYADRADASTMVVIDRSGSMNVSSKLDSAKAAAGLYIDSWRNGDLIGVASFSDEATINRQLGDFATERDLALAAIRGLVGDGDTSIGDGAQIAMQNLIDRDSSARPWSIMILSDGIENRDILVADFLNNYNARRNATPAQKVPQVIAVALGPDADRARLEKLASDTGGVYYVASLPTNAAIAGTDAIHATTLVNDLAEIYRAGSEFIAGDQQIDAQVWPYTFEIKEFKFQVDGAASEATFVLHWDRGYFPYDYTYFRKPNGEVLSVAPIQVDSVHALYRIAAPEPGEWTVVVNHDTTANIVGTQSPDATLPSPTELWVEASLSSDLTLNAFLGLPVEQRLVGNAMPIYASLADGQPLSGATVNASIVSASGFHIVTLYDDGLHGDGGNGDGFYAATYYNTNAHGAYDVVVTASGVSPVNGAFIRRARLGFNMLQSRFLDFDPNFPNYDPNYSVDWDNPNDPNRGRVDKDGDKIVDGWERATGLDPDNSVPGQLEEDPDNDGLTNELEFLIGTNPLTSDTDQGGENDGSEFYNLGDPLDPKSDQISCLNSFYVTGINHQHDEPEHSHANLLYFDIDPEHDFLYILRAEGDGPAVELAPDLPATGVYSDTNVIPGTTYTYWASAYNNEGSTSCVLGPATITTAHDSLPPEGLVDINGSARTTEDRHVTLSLEATVGTTHMQVRNDPASYDAGEGWIDYAESMPWELAPEGGSARVFVWYRDEVGNVSEPAYDAIVVEGEQQETPELDVSPTSLSFTGQVGGANPGAKSFAISNRGGGILNWSVSSNVAWATLSSGSGTDADDIVVSVDTTGMELGTYNGTITVSANNADGSPKTVSLTLVVQEDAPVEETDLYLPAARK